MPQKKSMKEEFDKFLARFESLILTGVLKPRERLIEANLAEVLNVSRYWIRDGLKLLEAKCLVKIVPYKGAVVADLNRKEIQDIFIIRVTLERLAVQLALQNITSADTKVLKKLAREFEASYKKNNIQDMIKTNEAFHDYIFQLSRNQALVQMIVDLRTRLHIVRYAAWSSPEVRERITIEHQLYIKALQKKDVVVLNELSERHISYSKDLYLAQQNTVRAIMEQSE
ncbi:MAG: GntR family transcriptional regulator [Desulfobacteraceae bacterium]|nr:MAG: GntR family transcriptional regulator [Desulfobacteraceae bacterium]